MPNPVSFFYRKVYLAPLRQSSSCRIYILCGASETAGHRSGIAKELVENVFHLRVPGRSTPRSAAMSNDFYLRYYVGHRGKFGHEFLEFEFRPDGKLRYANNSNYKNDVMIRKEAYVHRAVMDELRRIIEDSEIMQVRAENPFCVYNLRPLFTP